MLRRSLVKSKILPDSVVVFDGFTGFTPIQNRLIQELMRVCEETIVTVTLVRKKTRIKWTASRNCSI